VVNLDKDRYVPVMIVSIGKADEEGFPSVRLTFDDTAKII
jgi:nitroreductase